MKQQGCRLAVLTAAGLVFFALPARAQEPLPVPGGGTRGPVLFSKEILPIFQNNKCQNCHGAMMSGGLKLDTIENVLLGGTKGPIITPGDATESRLIKYLDGRLKPQMPLNGRPLTRSQIALISTWIQQGAKDDAQVATAMATAEKPLEILEPKDGSEVREKVRVVIPRASIPVDGFVGIYIDKQFKVALAPPSVEDLADKGMPPDAPVVYIWDTKAPLTSDQTVVAEEAFAQDGPHVIAVRSYNNLGTLVEEAAAQVTLKNKKDTNSTQALALAYGGREGLQYEVEHAVDLKAEAGEGGTRGGFGAPAAQTAGGPNKLEHTETSRYLVALEDVMPATGIGFWRERRESPLTVVVNSLKQVVRLDTSSRYYALQPNGTVRKSKVMEREHREPILNPIDLPGRPQRMNQPFKTTLRLNLGAYIPATLVIDNLQAQIEGVEWQDGEECARIRLLYQAGQAKVDLNSLNIQQADFQVENGTSTVWFSLSTNRIIKAKHDVTGTLVVDVAQLGGGQPGSSGMGGELAPGAEAGGAEAGAPYGAPGGFGSPFAAPGGGRPGGFGSPFAPASPAFGGGGMPGYSGGMPGYSGGMPGYSGQGAPGYSGQGAPGYGAPGAPGYGAPGGAFPSSNGGNTGIVPTTKRYHVTLKVNTKVVKDESDLLAPPKASAQGPGVLPAASVAPAAVPAGPGENAGAAPVAAVRPRAAAAKPKPAKAPAAKKK